MEVKRERKIGEKHSLDRRYTSIWGRQRLARVGMSVGLVVQWQVMIGAVVAPIESPGGPIKTELILGGAATQPVKPNVHSFGMTRHNCVVSDSGGSGAFSLKGIRWLRTTHFNKFLA